MTFPVLSANGPSGYNLTRSLRFRSNASAYLNRTPATTTNQTTFTWSGWVKRGALGGSGCLFFAGANSTYWFAIQFSSDGLGIVATNSGGGVTIDVSTPAVYRDPSSWYHIVLKIDSTQATAARLTHPLDRKSTRLNSSQTCALPI